MILARATVTLRPTCAQAVDADATLAAASWLSLGLPRFHHRFLAA